MTIDLLTILKRELEANFGRKIRSSRDCLQLVEDIRTKTGFSVNSNTLRRFFGLVKSPYKPSPSTLTILLKYCGYHSLEELAGLKQKEHKNELPSHESVLHFLIGLYRHLPKQEGRNAMAEAIVEQTIFFLERHPGFIDPFHREIARTEAGRYYYFELAVNMDCLNQYYGDGLKHYLQADPQPASKIFTHSLLAFRYWLSNDIPQLEKQMQELLSIPVPANCPSHILGRQMSARILFAHSKKQSIDPILADATKYLVSLLAGSQQIAIPTYPDFELAICEALVLIGNDGEGSEFIRRGKSLLGFAKRQISENPFKLWEYLIQQRMNPTRRAIPGTTDKNLPSSGILQRKYQNLLRLSLLPSNQKSKRQLADLVNQTGYKIFEQINTGTRKSRIKS